MRRRFKLRIRGFKLQTSASYGQGELYCFWVIIFLIVQCSWIFDFSSNRQSLLKRLRKVVLNNFKHELSSLDFLREFRTHTHGWAGVKKFLPISRASEKRIVLCGRPRFSALTSMTRRFLEKLCEKSLVWYLLAPNFGRMDVTGICLSRGRIFWQMSHRCLHKRTNSPYKPPKHDHCWGKLAII